MRLVPTRMQWVGRCTGPTQELEQLKIENPFSIRVMARDSYQLTASLDLPDNHAYEGKQFDLAILVPDSYPFSPPEVHFITPIYHINVTEGGVICMDMTKWCQGMSLNAWLRRIQNLLATPDERRNWLLLDTEYAADPQIEWEYRHREEDYLRKAQMGVLRHDVRKASP